MTDYREGSTSDHADLCEPAPRAWYRCECSYVGWMRFVCMNPGSTRDREPSEWLAVCPQCGLEHDEYGDGS